MKIWNLYTHKMQCKTDYICNITLLYILNLVSYLAFVITNILNNFHSRGEQQIRNKEFIVFY